MKIQQAEVLHIARLSRLSLSEAEVEQYGEDLNSILGYMDALNALNTDDIPPTSHAVTNGTVMRDDAVLPSLPLELVMANAPDHDMDHFRVPPVIE
ncbi:Asp-tRNA(Asn)/Glu-tRNA(Gln) amidotransferase subunit GatC [Desulfurispirillum indicum]|uniref:Asp-tRNA(Asn)/Glu-tRNA(Gln) amidotransferase subunit GatC n=1 Tax=Desulfurispirillum indicum TaxID=936456 RepID=UPI001CF9BCB0|nr:Asp-tRNA(Asn)/Glu-tRNA(Gln) amidotransferase subunit GatC [Desulfurispirillum indicum]UCZ55874.1 Asp-tRNA(Asn)/Glu-tRNA(Gln) amidotransferase subunit GatC [Desulfurispirillum indicum]